MNQGQNNKSSCRLWERSSLCAIGVFLGMAVSLRAQESTNFGARIDRVSLSEHGVQFLHDDGSFGKHFIMETVIGSLALFDYDGDGLVDMYLTGGTGLPGGSVAPTPRSRLYRNLGEFRFVDVTERAGIRDGGYAMGCVAGDFDNDGDLDLFLTHYGENVLYQNNGDGTFVDIAKSSGLCTGTRIGAGSVFLDMDLDGDLDIFSASYVEFRMEQHRVRVIDGESFSVGPSDYPPAQHYVFRNEADGSFSDVSQWAGMAELKSPGMSAISADFDNDGDFDVFLANDQSANFLLENDGRGRFVDIGIQAGVALDREGKANGNMGIEYADLDGDGLLDFLTTTYQQEMPVLYRCQSPGVYADTTSISKIDRKLFAHVTWGVGAVDFDNDKDRDLFFACGHFFKNLHHIDDRTQFRCPNFLLANNGKGIFSNVSATAGDAMAEVESSRGAAFDDLDNDGDVDIVVLNINAPPTLGRTHLLKENRQISLQLVGRESNRDSVGSVVELQTLDGQWQKQVMVAGRGYESHYGSRLYFGIANSKVNQLRVTWPTGKQESFPLSDTSHHLLIEGSGSR